MSTAKSKKLYAKASKIIPGGVDSPVRAFGAVGGDPLFFKKAKGSKIYDVDNNEYIDYVGSWGPMILGHANKEVTKAIKAAADDSTSFGASSPLEVDLAELVLEAIPTMDMVRFVSSGTEATMSAIRLARAYTKREGMIKFEGCYHGHSDSFLIKAGSGAATFGTVSSPGVVKDLAKQTFNAKFNNIESVEKIFKNNKKKIAAVIVEAMPGNMGNIYPEKGFYKQVRDLCKKYGALLIMDEVMSGFRLGYGGAHNVFKINPDLVCFGKVIGGGLPVGAFGGKRKYMKMLAPSGPVYQAGTLSGNPLAMSAGIAMLKQLKDKKVYTKLFATTEKICEGIKEISERRSIDTQVVQAGSMFTIFFSKKPVRNYQDAAKCDHKMFGKYFQLMLKNGVFLPPSQYEANFVGTAHSAKDVTKTLEAVDKSFKNL